TATRPYLRQIVQISDFVNQTSFDNRLITLTLRNFLFGRNFLRQKNRVNSGSTLRQKFKCSSLESRKALVVKNDAAPQDQVGGLGEQEWTGGEPAEGSPDDGRQDSAHRGSPGAGDTSDTWQIKSGTGRWNGQ
ncbi:MAG: hypothetical protein GY738_20820, partial [Pseudoalteromonas sp.]|nr:hypothetical protein [Pseudoalteromonas sp.]